MYPKPLVKYSVMNIVISSVPQLHLPHRCTTMSKSRVTINHSSLLHLTRVYHPGIRPDQVLKLQILTDATYELQTILVLCTGPALIWRNRQAKKATSLYETRAEIKCLIVTLRKSRPRSLREASSMIQNTLDNFPHNS